MLTVYHGATCEIVEPLCTVGRSNLDFGQGFYITDLLEQAHRWAINVGRLRRLTPCLNIYHLDIDRVRTQYRCLHFEAYDAAWLDFIASSRRGLEPWSQYDFIEGGVADDRVVNTVEDYLNGDITAENALGKLTHHHPNNQMCILSQKLLKECLHYQGCELLDESQTQKGGAPC